MLKLKQSAMAVLALVALSACNEIETPDGRVPAEFLGYAQQLVGSYGGQFEGQPTTIGLQMNGDMPYVTVTNTGNDILGPSCRSQIGQLVSIRGEKHNNNTYSLESATFAFSPGNCNAQGRTVTFEFSRDYRTIDASILQSSHTITYLCHGFAPEMASARAPRDWEPPHNPIKWCHDTTYNYYEGRMTRF